MKLFLSTPTQIVMLKRVKKIFLALLFFLVFVRPPGVLAATKDPGCNEPQYTQLNTNLGSCTSHPKYKDYCCLSKGIRLGFGSGNWLGNPYACINKANNYPINKCNELEDNAVFIDKRYCGNDGMWMYDATKKKCVRVENNNWMVIKADCNKIKNSGVQTAIGCIPTDDLTETLKFALKWVFFASGGIILLMTIATGYTVITSQGNPEKLQAAKENIVALFSGLILIAFSLILLQTIGADVLKLPTF